MLFILLFFFFKQKTAYEMRISDWSSDVCSSDLLRDDGLADLSRRLADTAPTLQSLIASGAWDAAEQAGRADGPDFAPGAFAPRPPIGANARIFCVGAHYPHRSGEYRDDRKSVV